MDKMKAKSLIVVLIVVSILLIYSVVCYRVLNKRIEINTKNSISTYFSHYLPEVSSYEYIKAISNEKGTFQVFVKAENHYYTFHFGINSQGYLIQDVDLGVPSYIH